MRNVYFFVNLIAARTQNGTYHEALFVQFARLSYQNHLRYLGGANPIFVTATRSVAVAG